MARYYFSSHHGPAAVDETLDHHISLDPRFRSTRRISSSCVDSVGNPLPGMKAQRRRKYTDGNPNVLHAGFFARVSFRLRALAELFLQSMLFLDHVNTTSARACLQDSALPR